MHLLFIVISLFLLSTSSLAEGVKLLPDGKFLRTGWISAEKEGCGRYSKDEWSCRKAISKDGNLYWDVGCLKNAPKCESGMAVSVAAVKGNNPYSYRTPENKGCIRQWIMWECGNKPPTKEEKYKFFKTGEKHHVWAIKMKLKEEKLSSGFRKD